MSYRYWTASIVLLFLLSVAANAQDSKVHDPLFGDHDILEVRIEAPFAMLAKERPDEEEAAGKLRFPAEDGSLVDFDINIRTRGRYRRTKAVCNFPPLRLNLKKSQTKDTLFDKQDKLKLVTHCRNKARRYEQSVVSEYLTYRILNLLTDTSFRVRLLRITYVYTDDDRETESYAILIEHKDRLGKRIDAKPQEIDRVRVTDIRRDDMNITSVFHYLIGNTDFSPVAAAPNEDCCHNQALFAREGELHFTVPYDFDQSGLVNAPHASPNPRFGLRSVRERLYRGRCINNDYLPATLDLFRVRRDNIEALVSQQEELLPGTRRYMLSFIEKFYDTIDDPKRTEKEFVRECI
jgi:hypothetical protein